MLTKKKRHLSESVHKRDEGSILAESELKLTPDVRLYGEFVVSQTFRCSPFNRELGSSVSCVCVSSH